MDIPFIVDVMNAESTQAKISECLTMLIEKITYTIRSATVNDAPELARLFTELGHPSGAEQIVRCWPEWSAMGNTAFVAAQNDENLLAAITLHQMRVLHRPRPVGRITALIVDSRRRGHGMGKKLVATAESEFIRAGCGLLEITSHTRLVDAHAFYEHLGYQRTSIRLMKELPSMAHDYGMPGGVPA